LPSFVDYLQLESWKELSSSAHTQQTETRWGLAEGRGAAPERARCPRSPLPSAAPSRRPTRSWGRQLGRVYYSVTQLAAVWRRCCYAWGGFTVCQASGTRFTAWSVRCRAFCGVSAVPPQHQSKRSGGCAPLLSQNSRGWKGPLWVI